MSASMSPTRWPCICKARARLAATVDLPTPPLPLATAMMCLIPAMAGLADMQTSMTQLSKQLDGVNAGIVPVVPGDLIGIVPAGRHFSRLGGAGRDFAIAQQLEWIGRFL